MANRKLNDLLKKALDAEVGRVSVAIAEAAPVMGETIVDEIRRVVAVGNSPIEGRGRFPGYKAVEAAKTIKKLIKSARGRKASAEKVKHLKSKLKERAGEGYPYSVQDKFPGKRPRPVNLFLSGEMLGDLVFKVLPKGKGLEIGFFAALSQKKELGHREGANGQPKRPIIPVGEERFSVRIMQKAIQAFEKALAKKLKRA